MSNSFVSYTVVLNDGEIPIVTEDKLSILINSMLNYLKPSSDKRKLKLNVTEAGIKSTNKVE